MSKPRSLPAELRAVLPEDTQAAWQLLAPILPPKLYLAGGTGVAVHLRHRVSRDLDFFYHSAAVDLEALSKQIAAAGQFAVTLKGEGTLRGLLGETKLEFLHADEVAPQRRLETPRSVGGIRVAGMKDLLAMKLKVIRERGEMARLLRRQGDRRKRPIQRRGRDRVFWFERYGIGPESENLQTLVTSLGYLEDVEPDESLPIDIDELAKWWRRRQKVVVRNVGRIA